jgi:protein phosphatase
MKFEAWSGSNVGLRPTNQDSVGCYPDLGLAVVADGMGGRKQGELASRLAVEIVHDSLDFRRPATLPWWRTFIPGSRGAKTTRAPADQLADAIDIANRRIFEAGRDGRSDGNSMGTTVVVLQCSLNEAKACWAHVGDSRLYRWRDQKLELLTADHTAHGEIYWRDSHIPTDLPHTNSLLRAVGVESSVNPSVGTGELQVGDLYLLCSDGVSGPLTPATLAETLGDGADLPSVGETLIRRALEAGGRDNASVVLVRMSDGVP